jgi:Protein kinase domain
VNQFCHNCGGQIPADAVFCGLCGARAAAPDPTPAPPPAAPIPEVSAPASSDRLRHLFDQAGAVDPSRREAWLQAVCQGDPQLLNQLRGMLTIAEPSHTDHPTVTHVSSPQAFADQPSTRHAYVPQAPGPSGVSNPQAATPQVGVPYTPYTPSVSQGTPPIIGPYRLLRELGRGGMGVVYLAARDDGTFRKNVALKLLLRDQVNEEFVLRFKQERQVLAALDHPNIARILDGGDAPDGMPYYVMEYVEGLPLDGYCDQQRLSLTARIKIFQQVCMAVHYLHQNSIVHRDLKPSNILVSSDGVIKLLDFGIAKVVGAASFATPDLTSVQGRPMTPTYASPEQINGATLQKASDIYSLGVILYGLLTGRPPYQGLDDKLAKLATRQDPQPPSSNIREDLRASETTAQLRRAMLGELDSIVMMALKFDPRDRYQSSADLAADLQCFLDGQPVTAHRGNMAGRGFKALKRKRAMVAVLAGFLILGGFGGWQFWRFQVEKAEVAAREEKLRNLLDQLEARLNGEARVNASSQAPVPAPPMAQAGAPSTDTSMAGAAPASSSIANEHAADEQIQDVQKLQKALKEDFAALAARRPGKSAQQDALLDRSVRYLDRVQSTAPANANLGLEIATSYEKVAEMQEATASTANKSAAVSTYRKAATTLSAAAAQNPQDPRAQQRLTAVNQRIQALGGTVVVEQPAPVPDLPKPEEPKPEPPKVVEQPPPPIRTPPPKVVTPPPAPVVETPKPSVAVPPASSMPQITAAEKRELQELLINATSKVQIADSTIAPVKASLERTGQSLSPDILSSMNSMHAAIERAKREIAFGNQAAARESIAAAEGLAAKVLRSVGR